MKLSKAVFVKGTPYEQGVQQAQQAGKTILQNILRVREMMEQNHFDMDAYRAFIQKDAEYIQRTNPELTEEMHGIADGLELPFQEVLYLNIPAYFMKDHFRQECSMLLVKGKATLDGKTYLIKNRDMSCHLEQLLISREYPDGMKLVEVNGAGTVTYPAMGINSYGVAVTNTGFWSPKAPTDYHRVGKAQVVINSHIILRRCKTAEEGLDWLLNTPRINGLNMIIADSRDAYLIEVLKDGAYVEKADEKGVLFRSNHYVSRQNRGLNTDPKDTPSTFFRYERIQEMVKERYGELRFQDLYRIMSDHKDAPNCLCRHPQPGAPGWTASSTLCVVDDRELWSTIGNPCEMLPHAGIES